MIEIKHVFEKSALSVNSKEVLFLAELYGHKNLSSKKERPRLNICLCIDVSSSMNNTVNTKPVKVPVQVPKVKKVEPWPDIINNPPILWNGHPQYINGLPEVEYETVWQYSYTHETKIEQARKAAIQAVKSLNDNDIISIVLFNEKASVLLKPVKIDSSSRKEVIEKIESINAYGNTNLNDGWVLAATEVSKNLKKDGVNRVLLISDGQTNSGEQRNDVIAQNVFSLYQTSISTSTFGLGKDFNEDLLQKMSNSGGGNFYYIDENAKLSDMFEDEFSGLSNLCASEVKISFELNKGVEIAEQMNDLVKEGNAYLFNTISSGQKVSLLFKMALSVKKNSKNYTIGTLFIDSKDENGSEIQQKIELKLPVVSTEEWDKLEYNEELKVQETLMIIAKNKISATQALDKGDIQGAQGYLNASVAFVGASGLNDSRLSAENSVLLSTLTNSANYSSEEFRKDLSYQSYKTRYSKNT
jgi:Ca-activated chloride channel homolog